MKVKESKSSKKSDALRYSYMEVSSSYQDYANLSVCHFIGSSDTQERSENVLFFIPEIGVSYRNYTYFIEHLVELGVFSSALTYDHYGCGTSGGIRGKNIFEKNYLRDFQKIYELCRKVNKDSNIYIFGHGFGANLALLSESEGLLDNSKGLIIKNPFLEKNKPHNFFNKLGKVINSNKVKKYINLEKFSGIDFFPTIKDQNNFDRQCLNSRTISLDLMETFDSLSKSVIERSYLAEKPILFIHSEGNERQMPSELINLYQKGVGENIVTSLKLEQNGYFEMFLTPEKRDINEIVDWVSNCT